MRRLVCIHGHFYQPPRQNPWSHEVEREASASPYHDWNERIASECYAPNSSSPLLDDHGKIIEVFNNYVRMSFDFGPTLLRWIESHYSELYASILAADKESTKLFSGHGSAMAQVYNHMIMPLASPGDKLTQTRWGAEDFETRFGRYPEGMWLPETAVDTATLEALAENKIMFTVLSPKQAAYTRRGDEGWVDVSGGKVDTRRPYSVNLPSGKSISVFFYDDGISNKIAFGDLLTNGERMARTLLDGFTNSDGVQLVNVASDGETYGHHHRNGNLVLTRSLFEIERSGLASLTNYGLFLSLSPPTHEVKLVEPSSWSCPHGVERWRSSCGCGSDIKPGYNQEWRVPLRRSLDWLRDRLAEVYSNGGRRFFLDEASAKEELGSSAIGSEVRIRSHLEIKMQRPRSAEDERVARSLLEMVECASLMYASCAWFWEDITRPETRQMLRYAARAMEIAAEVSGTDLRPKFEEMIGSAVPNDQRFKTGRGLFSQLVSPGGLG
jgi:alpha-amylase/alpha-mannosidase (GH57 family)